MHTDIYFPIIGSSQPCMDVKPNTQCMIICDPSVYIYIHIHIYIIYIHMMSFAHCILLADMQCMCP